MKETYRKLHSFCRPIISQLLSFHNDDTNNNNYHKENKAATATATRNIIVTQEIRNTIVSEDLYDVVIETTMERNKLRVQWIKRFNDPIFNACDVGIRPIPSMFDRTCATNTATKYNNNYNEEEFDTTRNGENNTSRTNTISMYICFFCNIVFNV